MRRSPLKDNDKTRLSNNYKDTALALKNKSKSQINIRKKERIIKQEGRQTMKKKYDDLQQKIQISKDILTTIYNKVKRKESIYQNQLSEKDLYLNRIKQLATDYKKLYQNGLQVVQKCIDDNLQDKFQQKQSFINNPKRVQMKRLILNKIKQKKANQNIQINKRQLAKQTDKKKEIQNQSHIHENKKDNPLKRMKKSSSAIYTKKGQVDHSKIRKYVNKKQIQLLKPQKQIKQQQKQKVNPLHIVKKQELNEQKSLYEKYRQRLDKRQKQNNSQKMGWIVQKLQQNIKQLQMIRKKSQLKLNKITKNQKLKPKSVDRQKSKQKYIQIQKQKLKQIQ